MPRGRHRAAGCGNSGPAKRRKGRRGTATCKECKRRKVRCHSRHEADDSICTACRKADMRCSGQDARSPSPDGTMRRYQAVGEQIRRVEALVSRLLRQQVAECFRSPAPAPVPRPRATAAERVARDVDWVLGVGVDSMLARMAAAPSQEDRIVRVAPGLAVAAPSLASGPLSGASYPKQPTGSLQTIDELPRE